MEFPNYTNVKIIKDVIAELAREVCSSISEAVMADMFLRQLRMLMFHSSASLDASDSRPCFLTRPNVLEKVKSP